MVEPHPYYTTSLDGMVSAFSEGEPVSLQILARYFGRLEALRIWKGTLGRFSAIYLDLPFIGGDENPRTWNLAGAAFGLAFYLELKEMGRPIDEAGKVLYLLIREFMVFQAAADRLPACSAGGVEAERRRIMASCAATQQKEYQGNWVSTFVQVDPSQFDYGWDNYACGIKALLERYHAPEFLPYLCLLDQVIYPARGLGLTRTTTLAGGDRCDFRVRAGGPMDLRDPASAAKLKEWGFVR